MFPATWGAGDPKKEQAVAALLGARQWIQEGARKRAAYGWLCLICRELGLDPFSNQG